jgi:hypothetical protein
MSQVRRQRSKFQNGANGMSDIEGKAPQEAASEWSRGDASDIDGQTESRNERQRISQFSRSWLHRLVRPLMAFLAQIKIS